jgi:hypothetical protein
VTNVTKRIFMGHGNHRGDTTYFFPECQKISALKNETEACFEQ